MNGLFFVGIILLVIVGGSLLYALLCPAKPEQKEALHPFAILPVPDASPPTEALLRRYASQIAWMDAEVLRCVILVYLPEDAGSRSLCCEMAREYDFYTAMSLPDAQHLLEARTAGTENSP